MSAPCLALDATGRRVAVPLRLVAGPEAVATKVRMRLESLRGSWIEDTRIGLPWLAWQDAPATPAVVLEGAVRRQVREVGGVLSVERVHATRVGADLHLELVFTAATEEAGPVRIRVSTTEDPAVPGAWFLLLPRTRPLIGA